MQSAFRDKNHCALVNRPRCGVIVAAALLALALTALPPRLTADEPSSSASTENSPRRKNRVSRGDLAASYLRFELALAAHPPAPERLAELNRGFDAATLAFFSGRNAEAIASIDALAASLSGAEPSLTARLAASVRATIEPRVWTAGDPSTPQAVVRSLYEVEAETGQKVPLTLRLRLLDNGAAVDIPLDLTTGSPVELTLDLADLGDSLSPSEILLEIVMADGQSFAQGRWTVAARSFDEIREANAARLASLSAGDAAWEEARAACGSRNALLTDRPSQQNSAQFLADLSGLSSEVAAEIDALAAGHDPYRHRAGDYWRTVTLTKRPLPLRVYAPAAAATDTPVPLVVALHGAGGDENMFLSGYGAGMIRRLADERTFLVASPRTETLAGDAQGFARMVDALSLDYAIDRARIYVIGHSMGGGAASRIAARDAVRGVACLAGFNGFSGAVEKCAPLLAIGAELDPIIPAARIEAASVAAKEKGLPVEYRLKPNLGHTLVVGATLGEALDWLWALP